MYVSKHGEDRQDQCRPTNTRSHVLSNRFALGPVYLGHETTQHKLIRSSARSIPCNMVSFSVLVDVIR